MRIGEFAFAAAQAGEIEAQRGDAIHRGDDRPVGSGELGADRRQELAEEGAPPPPVLARERPQALAVAGRDRAVLGAGAWARAGYVVAAPQFPLTSTRGAPYDQVTDFVNQPADISLAGLLLVTFGAAAKSVP